MTPATSKVRDPAEKTEWESHYDHVLPTVDFDEAASYDLRDAFFAKLVELGAGAHRSLEFGSGRGVCSFALKRAHGSVEPTLLDFSEHAVAYSREFFRQARFGGRFVVGSFLQLPFPDAHFDLVFGNTVLEHVRDTARAVAELVRVTAPGGRLLITVPNRNRRFDHDMFHVANDLKYYSRTFAPDELDGLFRGAECDIVDRFGVGLVFMPPTLIPRYLYRRLRGPKHTEARPPSPEPAAPAVPRRGALQGVRAVVRAVDDAVLAVERNLGFMLAGNRLVPSHWLITIGIVAQKRKPA